MMAARAGQDNQFHPTLRALPGLKQPKQAEDASRGFLRTLTYYQVVPVNFPFSSGRPSRITTVQSNVQLLEENRS